VHAVHSSGGRAVLVTPDDPDPDVLAGLDGIMFTGGSDVDPALYGESPHPTTHVKPERDKAEMMLMRAAIAEGLPMLGICRGIQLMAVAYGGRLHQHLPDVLGHDGHRPLHGPKFGQHAVRLRPGSRAAAILGDAVVVNSFHHQGVADPGRLAATGLSPEDDLIEVVEDPALPFAVGVQWHPEDTNDFRLFAALVEAAAYRRVSVS
jgi:putative glutamine amidotransferase